MRGKSQASVLVRLVAAVLMAGSLTLVAVPPAQASGFVTVVATTHVQVNSMVVDANEQSMTYDFTIFLDDFPRYGTYDPIIVTVLDGAGVWVTSGGIAIGGSLRISGTRSLFSYSRTPEDFTHFRFMVYQQVGYPATVYRTVYKPVELGWVSPSARGDYVMNSWYQIGNLAYYDIDVSSFSLGGAADEVCGYVGGYAHCFVELRVIAPDGSVIERSKTEVPAAGSRVTKLTNIGGSGMDVSALPAGSRLAIAAAGQDSGKPTRVLEFAPFAPAPPGTMTLSTTPATVKRNTPSVTLVAALSTPIGSYNAVTPGIAIMNADTEEVLSWCPGVQKCNATIPLVGADPTRYVAAVLDASQGYAQVADSPADIAVLPNANGPSDYELNGGYVPSQACSTASHGDPVNTATGEYSELDRDLSFPCVGPPLTFARAYSSALGSADEGLGFGWSWDFGMKLAPVDTGSLTTATRVDVTQETGSVLRFYGAATAGYTAEARVQATLTKLADGTYEFQRGPDEHFIFDSEGRLIRLVDRHGNAVRVVYDGADQAIRVEDDFARYLTIAWADGRIASVTDHASREVDYGYDSAGDLTTYTDFDGLVTAYEYDASHRMTVVTAPSGAEVANVYDAQSRVTSQTIDGTGTYSFAYGATSTTTTDPTGLVTREDYVDNMLMATTSAVGTADEATVSYTYDGFNNLASITDPFGRTTTFGYDNDGRKTVAQDALGNETRWIYDADGKLLYQTDATGAKVFSATYTALGDVATETAGDGSVTTYAYDSHGLVTSVTGPGSVTDTTTYDSHGNAVERQYADGSSSEVVFDDLNRPTSVTEVHDRDGDAVDERDTTVIAYNNRSQATSTTDASGATSTSTYDALGRLQSSVDDADNASSYGYDSAGRLAWEDDALGNRVTYAYDAYGRQVSATDADGGVTSVEYDARGLVAAQVDAMGGRTEFEYDKGGRLVSTTDPLGRVSATSYDALGRVASTTNPAEGVTTYAYDANSRQTRVTDPSGRISSFAYDVAGRPVTETRPDGATWTTTYDAFGGVSAEKDWANETSSTTIDSLGRPTAYSDFAGQNTSYTYRDDLVASVTLPTGVATTYAYDALGRATVATHSTNDISQRGYDTVGQLVSSTDPGGTVGIGYDADGRPTSVTGDLGDVSYEYTDSGDLGALVYPSGLRVEYSYDAAHRMTGVSLGAGTDIALSRDDSGAVTSISYPNGVDTTLTYDSAGRLASGLVLDSVGTQVFGDSYTFATDGLLASESFTRAGVVDQSRGIARDSLGRVNSLTAAGGTVSSLQYSASHTPTLLDTGVQATLGAGGRLASSLATSGATTTYQYDQYGRRTAEASSDPSVDARTYGYDAFGHMTDSTVGSSAASYTTTQGLRSSQTVGETTTDYVWDLFAGVPTLLEDDEHAYVYATGSSPVAQVDLVTGEVEYLHGDLTGSTRAVTDVTGAVVGTWGFTAYGSVASSSGDAAATRFLFAGEYRDDTGLYYLRARSYDPATGQFLTVDPALASTGMAYAYTAGDPLQQVDPMGLDSADSTGGQGVLAGIGNGVKSIGSGIVYGVNPAHWDDIKLSLQCGAEANGGGFGGWFTAANVQLNPMYAVIDNGDLAIQAAKDGRWGDAAEHGTVSVGIFALTVAPIKIPIARIAASTLRGVAAVMEKVRLPATAVTVLKGTAVKVGKLEGLVGGTRTIGDQRTVVVGRVMDRVNAHAAKIGADTYPGTPGWVPRTAIGKVSPSALNAVDLAFNRSWIRKEVGNGSRIVDIGEPVSVPRGMDPLPPSRFYNMELQEMVGYDRVWRDYQR